MFYFEQIIKSFEMPKDFLSLSLLTINISTQDFLKKF